MNGFSDFKLCSADERIPRKVLVGKEKYMTSPSRSAFLSDDDNLGGGLENDIPVSVHLVSGLSR